MLLFDIGCYCLWLLLFDVIGFIAWPSVAVGSCRLRPSAAKSGGKQFVTEAIARKIWHKIVRKIWHKIVRKIWHKFARKIWHKMMRQLWYKIDRKIWHKLGRKNMTGNCQKYLYKILRKIWHKITQQMWQGDDDLGADVDDDDDLNDVLSKRGGWGGFWAQMVGLGMCTCDQTAHSGLK